jgi:hypothetical protein
LKSPLPHPLSSLLAKRRRAAGVSGSHSTNEDAMLVSSENRSN